MMVPSSYAALNLLVGDTCRGTLAPENGILLLNNLTPAPRYAYEQTLNQPSVVYVCVSVSGEYPGVIDVPAFAIQPVMIHARMLFYMYIYTHICIHKYVHIHTYIHRYVCMYIYTHTYIRPNYLSVYVCMCMY